MIERITKILCIAGLVKQSIYMKLYARNRILKKMKKYISESLFVLRINNPMKERRNFSQQYYTVFYRNSETNFSNFR